MTAATAPVASRPHALYRFYDHTDRLLYIGITANLPGRLTQHRDDKPWWSNVARIAVEHHADRDAVLDAERRAIITERPLWNIQHNGERLAVPQPRSTPVRDEIPGVPNWTFTTRRGHHRTGPLWLYWEVHCDPISDDWYVDDITPEELWRVWLTRDPRDVEADATFGSGAFRILWCVEGTGTFEAAPFQQHPRLTAPFGNFLTHYSWPVNPDTGEPLQWSRLPVIDKVWRTTNLPTLSTTKGGFIQEATGWKPAPLQPYVNIHQLAAAARLYNPARGAK